MAITILPSEELYYAINVANLANTSSITATDTLSNFFAFRATKFSTLG
jgi:hypothetical protein